MTPGGSWESFFFFNLKQNFNCLRLFRTFISYYVSCGRLCFLSYLFHCLWVFKLLSVQLFIKFSYYPLIPAESVLMSSVSIPVIGNVSFFLFYLSIVLEAFHINGVLKEHTLCFSYFLYCFCFKFHWVFFSVFDFIYFSYLCIISSLPFALGYLAPHFLISWSRNLNYWFRLSFFLVLHLGLFLC